jgi:hypothetical protein
MDYRDLDHRTVVAINWATAALVNAAFVAALWALTFC